jgi:DNA-binding GntR family transcriptional regulator
MVIDPASPKWPKEQAAAEIRRRIEAGELGPRLPSHIRLAQMLGVSPMTVQKALAILRDEGLIYSRAGLGTFTADPG